MMKKLNIIIVAVLISMGFSSPALAAPYFRQEAGLVPLTNSIYYLGTTSPATLSWKGVITDQLCLTADTCRTTWPSGGAGGGGGNSKWATSTATDITPNGGGGIMVFASSTIGSGLGAGGLSVNGNATTTGKIWQTGTWAHFGASSCNTGGVMFGNLQGIETCGSDNTNTGGVQNIISNSNAGTAAWGGLTLNNNLADSNVVHFFGMFFNSSTYTDTSYGTAIGRANLGLIQNSDGTLALISSSSTEALAPQGIEFLTGGTATANIRGRINPVGNFGLGTTTPQWKFQIASSTGSQLTLSDPSTLTNNHWSFRNAGANLYLATSSPTTFATSTTAALSIDSNGIVTLPSHLIVLGNATATNATTTTLSVSGTASTSKLFLSGAGYAATSCLQVGTNGAITATGSACGSGGGGGNSKFATSTDTGYPANTAISPNSAIFLGIGTTTPRWQVQLATSTRPQLALSDGTLTSDIWTFRSVNGNLYLATSSPSGNFATSTSETFSLNTNGQVLFRDGSATSPTLAFSDDPNNGIFSPANDIFAIATNGLERFRIDDSSAYSGFGTTTPKWLLDLATSTRSQLTLSTGNVGDDSLSFRFIGSDFYIASSSNSTFATSTNAAFDLNTNAQSGLSLGTTSPTATLAIGTETLPTATASTTLALYIGNAGSTTPSLAVDTPNNNGTVLIATSTNAISKTGVLATGGKVFMSGLTGAAGAQTGYICYDANGQLIQDTAVCLVSALKFKKNINPLTLGLDAVLAMKPVTYFKKEPLGQDDRGEQIGFIADWSEEVVPDLVTHDSKGEVRGFNYEQYTAVLTKAIQELNAKVSGQRTQDNWPWFAIGILTAWNVILTLKLRKR